MDMLIAFGAIIVALLSVLYLPYSFFKKNGKIKQAFIGIFVGFVLFIFGVMMVPLPPANLEKENLALVVENQDEVEEQEKLILSDEEKDIFAKSYNEVSFLDGKTIEEIENNQQEYSKKDQEIIKSNIKRLDEEKELATKLIKEKQAEEKQEKEREAEEKRKAEIKKNFVSAKVTKHVDGDTVHVTTDDGQVLKIRMIGVNTPETVHPSKPVEFYGKEASDFTKEKIFGKKVYLEKDISETDRYGRSLRYIWMEIPEEITKEEIKTKMFNAILVAKGFANSSTYQPDVKYQDYFLEFEREARNLNVGLWDLNKSKEFEVANAKKTKKLLVIK